MVQGLMRTPGRLRACSATRVARAIAWLTLTIVLGGAMPTPGVASTPPNLLSAMNPGFEWEQDGWSFTQSSSGSTARSFEGASSVHVTGTVTNNDVSAFSSFVP